MDELRRLAGLVPNWNWALRVAAAASAELMHPIRNRACEARSLGATLAQARRAGTELSMTPIERVIFGLAQRSCDWSSQ